jgi:hypothetical protein
LIKLALHALDLRRTVYLYKEDVRMILLDALVTMQTSMEAEGLLCSAISLRASFVEATRRDGLCAEPVSVPLLDSRLAATLDGEVYL